MNIFQIIGLILVCVVALTHLIFVLLNKEKLIFFTKAFVMTSVIIFALISKVTNPLIYIGLVLVLVSDLVLLLNKNKVFFIIGISALLITNILNFIITSGNLPSRFNICYFGIVILMGYLLVESFKPIAKKKLKKMSYLCLSYLYTIISLFTNALILVITKGNINYILIMIGAIFLLVSGNILMINNYIKKTNTCVFLNTLFGIIGQLLIFISFIINF